MLNIAKKSHNETMALPLSQRGILQILNQIIMKIFALHYLLLLVETLCYGPARVTLKFTHLFH